MVVSIADQNCVEAINKEQSRYRVEKFTDKVVLHPQVDCARTVIFLHGLGDSDIGISRWCMLLPEFSFNFPPGTKVILPKAPLSPVTVNNGHKSNSWYDFINFDHNPDEVSNQHLTDNYG